MQFWALCSVLVLGVGVTYPYIHTYILQNPSCNSVHMHTFRELLDAPEAGGPSDPPLLLGHATRPVGNLTYARHEGRSTCTLCMQHPSCHELPTVLVDPKTVPTVDLAHDRYPTGSRVDIYWPGERQWFTAQVTDTRTEVHTVKREKVLCREIYCVYELDDHEQWHSLHNNKVREAKTVTETDPDQRDGELTTPSHTHTSLTSGTSLTSTPRVQVYVKSLPTSLTSVPQLPPFNCTWEPA